jgi:hypothetical protein
MKILRFNHRIFIRRVLTCVATRGGPRRDLGRGVRFHFQLHCQIFLLHINRAPPSTRSISGSFFIQQRQRRSIFRRCFNPRFQLDLHIFFGRLTVKSRVTRRSGHAHHCGGALIVKFLTRIKLTHGGPDCRLTEGVLRLPWGR